METRTMVENIQSIFQKPEIKRILIAALGIFFLIIFISIPYVTASFVTDKIYDTVKIGRVDVSKQKKEWALEKLNKVYGDIGNTTLVLKANGTEQKITYSDINVAYDLNKAVEEAHKLGRQGGFFKRLADIISIDFKERVVDIPITYDAEKIKAVVDGLDKNSGSEVKDDSYVLKGDKLVFTFGHEGKGINKDKAILAIENKIKLGEGGTLTFDTEAIEPKPIYAKSIPTEPKDAKFVVEDFRNIKFIPEVYGIKLDNDEFDRLRRENVKTNSQFSIDVEKIPPRLTVEDLKANMFVDVLGNYDTYYGSSPANRKENIRLAASKIGDIILGPGQEFSYNKIVGPRTIDRGFKLAHAYSNGKVIDDVGGGICQVSSTLYNAVIRADIAVTQRRNHMFTVAYAPAGMDATVNYGTVDFRFKNNTEWPIKIINNTTSSNVSFNILGTNTNKEKTVEFRQEVVKVIPQNVKTVLDNTLYEGVTKTEQAGSNGYVVNVYKITKVNGEVVKEELSHKDTYQPLEKIVRKGTKPAPPAQPKPPTSSTTTQAGSNTTPQTPQINDNSTTGREVPVINEEGPPPVMQ